MDKNNIINILMEYFDFNIPTCKENQTKYIYKKMRNIRLQKILDNEKLETVYKNYKLEPSGLFCENP